MSRVHHLAAAIALLAAPGGAWPNGAGEAPAVAPDAGARPCVERVALRVQRRYEELHDLSARFEQTTHVASLGGGETAVEVARGVVTLAKPGKMRWSYEEPEPSLVVSDGRTVWTFDPQAGEAQRFPVTEGVLEGAAVQFLLGRGDILREFEVGGGPCTGSPVPLELVPREPASYTRLRILADPASGQIVETSVFDLFGNVTRVRFQDVRTDIRPAEEIFRFTPPPGVRVLDVERQP